MRRVVAAAEEAFKNAAAAAEDLAENVERIVKAAAEAAARPARARIERGVAVLVVGGAFLRIAQRLVSLAEFLEFFLGGLVARIFVRMKFHGQLAVGLLDFLVVGLAADAEDFVIIAFGHGIRRRAVSDGFLATMTVAGRSSRSRNL